jgi:hypothetical protein
MTAWPSNRQQVRRYALGDLRPATSAECRLNIARQRPSSALRPRVVSELPAIALIRSAMRLEVA